MSHEKNAILVACGFFAGAALSSYIFVKNYKPYIDLETEESREDLRAIWQASGIVSERMKNPEYLHKGLEAIMTDFSFERMRLREEKAIFDPTSRN